MFWCEIFNILFSFGDADILAGFQICISLPLRYYATFKVRKSESLFYKINTFLPKKYLLHWIADRENIICKYIAYIFFQFWVRLLRFLFYAISKSSSFLWQKNILNDFFCIVLLFVWAQKVCLRFLKSYFELLIFQEINIFVLRRVFFSLF